MDVLGAQVGCLLCVCFFFVSAFVLFFLFLFFHFKYPFPRVPASGAPLFNADAELVGMHSSWDDKTACRHGVPLEVTFMIMTSDFYFYASHYYFFLFKPLLGLLCVSFDTLFYCSLNQGLSHLLQAILAVISEAGAHK